METTIDPPAKQTQPGVVSPGAQSISEKFASLMKETPPADPPAAKPPEAKPAAKSDAPPTPEPQAEEFLKDEPPANLSDPGKASWKAFRAKANQEIKAAKESAIAEAKKLQEELATLRTKTAVPDRTEELTALQKQLEEYDQQLKVVAIERNPKFKAFYGGRIDAALEAIKKTVGADGEKVVKLLQLPENEYRNEQLEEIVSKLPGVKQGEIGATIARLREIESERDAELAKAKDNYGKVQEQEQRERTAAQEKMKQKTEQVVSKALQVAKTMEAFKPKEGDDAHNGEIAARENFIKSFFAGQLSEDVVASIPALASEATFLKEKFIPNLQAEIKKRDEIIAGYAGTVPNPTPPREAPGKQALPKSFVDRYQAAMGTGA